MGDFKIIETQEQFDEAIRSRLERERAHVAKNYEGYISPEDFATKTQERDDRINNLTSQLNDANDKIKNHSKELAERDSRIKAYESHSVKTRIANEMGLSFEAVNFLQGEDEESIRKSAEALKNLVESDLLAPLANPEAPLSDNNDEFYKNLSRKLKGE